MKTGINNEYAMSIETSEELDQRTQNILRNRTKTGVYYFAERNGTEQNSRFR